MQQNRLYWSDNLKIEIYIKKLHKPVLVLQQATKIIGNGFWVLLPLGLI